MHVAHDGARRWPWFSRERFDLVLMDIQMPNLDGLSATRKIRALEGRVASIPIVALTANAMVEDRAAYLQAGMDDHVPKPVEARELSGAIARVMALQRAD